VQLHLLYCTVGALLWAALPGALASAAAMLQAGDAAYGNGDFSTAIRHYTTALDLDATAPLFYTKRAAAYMSLKKYSQALKDLDRAVGVDDTFMQGYLHRGKLHRCAASNCNSKAAVCVSLRVAAVCKCSEAVCSQLAGTAVKHAPDARQVESYGNTSCSRTAKHRPAVKLCHSWQRGQPMLRLATRQPVTLFQQLVYVAASQPQSAAQSTMHNSLTTHPGP
jgi:tetratricopeptide (TPR) repeat protein